jgi:DNA-binding NarL/FixJ family response regulator
MVVTDKGVVEGLLFAADGRATAETLATVLGRQGIGVTRSVKPDACFDLLGTCSWRFLIVDAGGETRTALGMLSKSRRVYPDIPALVLVRQGDTRTAVRAMKAGAADCLETPIEPDRLVAAVSSLCRQAAPEPPGRRTPLTRAERVVLSHILEGRTNQQIAEVLCRSPRTIEVHRRHLMTKLGVSNLVELVKRSMQMEEAARPHYAADR